MNINSALFNNGIYQNRTPFSGASALFAPAEKAQTALQKISDQIISGQINSEQLEERSRTAQIQKDSYVPKNTAEDPLADVRDELLELDMGILQMQARISGSYGNELSDFKEQLLKTDSEIQGYQDIIDGKTPLREGQNMMDVRLSCLGAKMRRERLIEFGKVTFGQPQPDQRYDDHVYRNLTKALLGECRFAEKSASDCSINFYAANLYSEIDRVMAQAEGRAEEAKRAVGCLYGILYNRGYGEKYKNWREDCVDGRETFVSQEIERWKKEMEQMKQTPLQEVGGKTFQTVTLL